MDILSILKFIINLFIKKDSKEEQTEVKEPTFNDTLDTYEIVEDFSVVNKWYPTGNNRTLESIEEFDIHHTEGNGTWRSLKKWMLDGERSDYYVQGIALFHFCLEKANDKIIQLSSMLRYFMHSSSGLKHDKKTLGAELIHKKGKFTNKQYDKLIWLIFDYLPPRCPNLQRIAGHDYNRVKYGGNPKGCPSKDFDWGVLLNEANRRGLVYSYVNEYIVFDKPIQKQYENLYVGI